ncbi:molecular chaperone TorD family protein [uncultured Adlercreutzia sp.]|uniref:TorD/DmsD family molecular chaperone n=1 Tax=uncultured Adlercreutzia sp. TaxID=875803 RepID=UPI0025F675AE|nr:molecular chaperone TorD family protein [uncultured Adlercreutzia sp.]
MSTTEDCASILEALLGRADFYDTLAALYFKPLTEEQIQAMAHEDLASFAGGDLRLSEGLHDMDRALMKRNTGTRQELAVDFTSAFAGTSSWEGRYAVPYESVFTSAEGLLFQDAYHEVHALFGAQGVERAPGYDYPDDHLSFMCGYLAILSRRSAAAIEQGDYAEADKWLSSSASFIDAHILPWFPDFRDLALHIVKTRFYRGVLKATAGFFDFDRELIDEMRSALSECIEKEGE